NARDFAGLVVGDGGEIDMIARFSKWRGDFIFRRPGGSHFDGQRGVAFESNAVFNPFQDGKRQKTDGGGGQAEGRVAGAQTKANDGNEPQGSGGGNAQHE